MKIDYPSEYEIEEQKKRVIERTFTRKMKRPGLQIVFFQCRTTAVINLLIYFLLMFVCASIHPEQENGGYLAFVVFPLTYFSFYFLSVFSEEQNEVIELKMSLCYSFIYLISLRMLYASIVSVWLNIILLVSFFDKVGHLWSIGSVGTSAMLILALASLMTYEKTGSVKMSELIISIWTLGGLFLMQYGTGLYHLIVDIVPVAVHITVTVATFIMFIRYIGKVEKQNAYGF